MRVFRAVVVAAPTISLCAPLASAAPGSPTTGSLGSSLSNSPAEDATGEARLGTLKDENLDQVRQLLQERDVEPSTIERLVDKTKAGFLLDADNPDMEPISTETDENARRVVERQTFADGSVAIVEKEGPKQRNDGGNVIAPADIGGCHIYVHQDWYRHDNCLISYNGINFSYSFRADYSAARFTGVAGVIRRVFAPVVHRSIGANPTSNNVYILREWQDGNISAEAAQTIQFQPWGGWWSWSAHLRLHVLNNTAWTST
ncbi:hypothetical protein [Dietzia sp. PP-33]|jgi:hypothetical protein|uniref:hypothetical protein n=1 Tax=Dietzia sp. PP-33 TaxID=2957500 RepID=UPI0029B66729|nr:hypothetical protein [Dietzia sp. PP-33]MDX2356558.1 hypothetical protein [Dietzia sp. PP-33]